VANVLPCCFQAASSFSRRPGRPRWSNTKPLLSTTPTTAPEDPNFGYRRAMHALMDAMTPTLRGGCLRGQLSEAVHCKLVEARPDGDGECSLPGSVELPDELKASAYDRLQRSGDCGAGAPACNDSAWTLCEIAEAGPDCLENGRITSTGWCYVDADQGLGDPELVAHCPARQKRILRLVDPLDRIQAEGAVMLISCVGGPEIEYSSEGAPDASR
jgi:hypothetical protein